PEEPGRAGAALDARPRRERERGRLRRGDAAAREAQGAHPALNGQGVSLADRPLLDALPPGPLHLPRQAACGDEFPPFFDVLRTVTGHPVAHLTPFRHTHLTAGLRSSGAEFRPRSAPRSGARFNWRGRSSSELPLRPPPPPRGGGGGGGGRTGGGARTPPRYN